ncbi:MULTISPECIES: iron-hydroxamate ABC transporter substrate-binding protein [unclassified Romboutsia]|uniref:iron-hydroxamate ABC transporter substrate-binding protein n=1 Tax=unclassified Romboutsia TaxID=2626894 RepID=UPI0008203D5C|nr:MULTISPECIES: iron-hydroxamate ABC transporter substrate-binding protein [unclassified Romboutsia]SCI29497.1 Probable siderophore-binding lipoprotein yfiY precursor [uncultured Clostridium sp.]
MRKRKSIALLTVAALSIGILTGCSSNNDSNNAKEETRVVNSVKGEVEIPSNPERIVDISGSSEELAILGHVPVATANVDSYATDSIPSYMEDKLGDATVVGHSMMETMDVEAIIAAEPDLIIMAERQEPIYEELSEIAPVVMIEDLSNDWEAKLLGIAELFDQKDEAQKWLDAYYEKAESLGNEIKESNGEQTYVAVLATSGQFMVFSEGGIGTIINTDMGLSKPENMPAQDSITLPTVSIEGLAEIDADHIVVIADASEKANLESSSVWSEIRAVKDGNVTILDASPYFSQAYNPIGRELLLEQLKDELIK